MKTIAVLLFHVHWTESLYLRALCSRAVAGVVSAGRIVWWCVTFGQIIHVEDNENTFVKIVSSSVWGMFGVYARANRQRDYFSAVEKCFGRFDRALGAQQSAWQSGPFNGRNRACQNACDSEILRAN